MAPGLPRNPLPFLPPQPTRSTGILCSPPPAWSLRPPPSIQRLWVLLLQLSLQLQPFCKTPHARRHSDALSCNRPALDPFFDSPSLLVLDFSHPAHHYHGTKDTSSDAPFHLSPCGPPRRLTVSPTAHFPPFLFLLHPIRAASPRPASSAQPVARFPERLTRSAATRPFIHAFAFQPCTLPLT